MAPLASAPLGLRHTVLVLALALSGCAHHPPDEPADPLESVNRAVFSFNENVDRFALKPVAQGYVAVTPAFAREGISNFFSNLIYPTTIVNHALQLKPAQAGADTARFLINSLFGVGGLIDVAQKVGLPEQKADFGQTLGYWGVGEGWFLMLPFLGPSDARDTVGLGVDPLTNPTTYLPGRYDLPRYSVTLLDVVQLRADLLPADALLQQQLDRYPFVRTAYLSRRQASVAGDASVDELQPESAPSPPALQR